ncbi:hypothetical protein UPYG_G00035090, partial [Umbra pygmaea]
QTQLTRTQNVRDYIVRADTYIPCVNSHGRLDEVTGFYPCHTCAACRDCCKKMRSFTSSSTNKEYTIRQFLTCNSCNVVYLITCPCKKQYVGKTTRKIKTRMIEHKSAIRRNDPKSPIARPFAEAGHPVSSMYMCYTTDQTDTQGWQC